MLLGLIGDIHGNDLALEAVLGSARDAGADAMLVTGDLVGYYFAPARVLALLDGWRTWMVRGNHEDMLARARANTTALDDIERKYGSGLRAALGELSREQLDHLCGLPHPLELELDSRRILLCHGAPWDNDDYIYPDASEETLRRCCESGHDVVVLGQTHYPMVKRMGPTVIVNPGSVGQPRDRKPGAAWAILDTENLKVTMRREPYDVDAVAAEAARRNPDLPYLVSVLKRT